MKNKMKNLAFIFLLFFALLWLLFLIGFIASVLVFSGLHGFGAWASLPCPQQGVLAVVTAIPLLLAVMLVAMPLVAKPYHARPR